MASDNFSNLKKIIEKEKFDRVQGILFDLGFSSWHLEQSKKGFSFLKSEPLDMRYSPANPLTAEQIVNYWSLAEIARILTEYGQETFSQIIAQKIIDYRKTRQIKTTDQLAKIIQNAVPQKRKRINAATQTFQALRIAVNGELKNLQIALPQALDILVCGGRIAVISFHSLEDRIAKNFFKAKQKENLVNILTKKVIRPERHEIIINPRSRSAVLRVVEKICRTH